MASSPGLDPVYNLSNLSRTNGIDAAVARFDRVGNSDKGFALELRKLLRVPNVLALVVSSGYDRLRLTLERELLDKIPEDDGAYLSSDPQNYLSSISKEFITTIATYFSALAPPTSVSATKYTQHNFNTPRVVVVLEAVVLIAKNDTPSTGFSWDASRRACDELGIAYPQTESEAETLCQDLLVGEEWGLRRATEFYLETLANPEMAQRIKETTLLVVDRPDPSEFPPRPPVPPTTAAPTNAVPTPMEAAEEEEPIAQIPVKPEAVQPYFNSAPEDFGAWQIFISQSCVSDLKKFHRSDRKSFNIIEKKIVELSTGFFSDSNHKRLVGGGNDDVAILEAKMTGDLRLVYRIDLYTDSAMQDDKQCIMIHGVFTHAQFDHRLWDRVSRSIGQGGQDYRNKCNYRVTPRDRGRGYNVTDPMSWPHDDKMMEIKSTARPEFSDDEFLQLHKILALEKFIPMSTNVFRSIMAEEDDNLAYRFKVSPTETQVIAFPSSCFVIGRSGTGKTTTMLFKLLSIETAHRQKGSKIRQIFLTQSHILAQRVQEYYAQLFGTEQHGYTKIEKSKLDSTGLVNLDEESDARGDLPAKYSELTDAHFPLFVTFNQIRRMLEKDLEIDYSDRYSGTSKRAATAGKMDFTEVGQKANMTLSDLIEGEAGVSARDKNRVAMKASLEKAAQQPFVTFQVFNHQYWKHFDQSLTANLDPAVVYSEIMGIICGHEDTLGTEGGYLSREAYLNLSSRRYASFANERSRLYSIFEKYRALKLKKGAYDSPQRSHSILDGLSRSMQKVDYLYVDECQDFLIVDIKLLKQLCSNPKGLFWGGDTAQTISLGSSFRFQDLKTVLYNEEQNEPLVKAGKRAAVESKTFQLLVNYRSHGGIVDAASSIISLISQMFPESIDELSPETAVVTGPKPCVFRGWDNGVVHFEQFLFGGEGAKGDFGARQVILVRNDAVREELRKELGEAGLILTLLESKGLEFDDVLMYGFFEDGAAQDSQWRVVLNAIEGEKNVPTLDGRKHAIVNTELKNLYVGITRARHHCWIWDSSVAAEPMVRYWQSKNLIKILGPGDPIPPLASESKPEEWHSTGRDLFRKGLYAQAASCFAKALRPDEQKIALAYQKRSDAQAIDGGPKKRAAFKLAGAAFMECADFVAVDSEKRILYKRAVDAFNEAEESELALIALSKSVDETEAAKLLADKGQLDQALELVRPKKGPSRVDAQVAKNIIQKAQLVFLQSERYSEASNLFAGLEAQLDFIRQHGLRQAHKAVLKIYGLPDVAADLYKIDGEFREAADALRTSGRSDSVDLAVRAILDGLWVQGFGHDLGQAAKLLVEDIRALKTNGLPLKTRDEITLFVALATPNDHTSIEKLKEIGKKYSTGQAHGQDKPIVALSYDRILRAGSTFTSSSPTQIIARLNIIGVYLSHLVTFILGPTNSDDREKLMGYRESIDYLTSSTIHNQFRVYVGSVLHKRLEKAHDDVLQRQSRYIEVSGLSVDREVSWILNQRGVFHLKGTQNSISESSLHPPPCLEVVISPFECKKADCTFDHSKDLTIQSIRSRLLMHLHGLIVMDKMHRFDWDTADVTPQFLKDTRRWWIHHIFKLVFPISYQLGNEQIIPSNNPNFPPRAFSTFHDWVTKFLEDLDVLNTPSLSDIIVAAILTYRWQPYTTPIFTDFAFLTERADRVDVNDLARFYTRRDSPIIAGLKFFRTIVTQRVQIDANTIVHFLEHVILAIILNERKGHKDEVAFHDLILPRSWILYSVRNKNIPATKSPAIDEVIAPVTGLLHMLHYWDGTATELLYEGRGSPRLAVKNALIFRTLRVLFLLGRNTWRSSADRAKLVTAVKQQFSTVDERFLYISIVQASGWDKALQQFFLHMPASEADQLVYLELSSKATKNHLPNVRRIVWKAFRDIESSLHYDLAPWPREVVSTPPTVPARSQPASATRPTATSSTPTPTETVVASTSATDTATSGANKKKKKKKKKASGTGTGGPEAANGGGDDDDDDMPELEPVAGNKKTNSSAQAKSMSNPPSSGNSRPAPQASPSASSSKANPSQASHNPIPAPTPASTTYTSSNKAPSTPASASMPPPKKPTTNSQSQHAPSSEPTASSSKANINSSESWRAGGSNINMPGLGGVLNGVQNNRDLLNMLTSLGGDGHEVSFDGNTFNYKYVDEDDEEDDEDDEPPPLQGWDSSRFEEIDDDEGWVDDDDGEGEEPEDEDDDDEPPPLEPFRKLNSAPTPAMNKASVPSPTSARPLTARKAPANKVDQNKFFKAISRDHDTLGEQSSSNLAGDASRPKRESVKKHSSSPAPRAQPNPGPSNTSSYPAGPGGMSIRPENDDDEYDSDGPPPLVPLNSR